MNLQNQEYYDILSSQFEKFCWGVRKNKECGTFLLEIQRKMDMQMKTIILSLLKKIGKHYI